MSTVLVVDDEPEILRMVETVLIRAGYNVVSASSGERAVEKIGKQNVEPDLLLTDVVMPGMSGPMLAEQLRGKYPDIKVLFMSGFDDRQVVKRYVKDPGFALLAKPFQLEDLKSKVLQLLA